MEIHWENVRNGYPYSLNGREPGRVYKLTYLHENYIKQIDKDGSYWIFRIHPEYHGFRLVDADDLDDTEDTQTDEDYIEDQENQTYNFEDIFDNGASEEIPFDGEHSLNENARQHLIERFINLEMARGKRNGKRTGKKSGKRYMRSKRRSGKRRGKRFGKRSAKRRY